MVFVMTAVISGCVTSQDEQAYKAGLAHLQQGNLEQAYAGISSLCAEYPEDERFCVHAEEIRLKIYEQNMSVVREKLGAQRPISLADLERVAERLEKASSYASERSETERYRAEYTSAKEESEEVLREALSRSAELAGSDPAAAYLAASEAAHLDSSAKTAADKYADAAMKKYIPEAERLIEEGELEDAGAVLEKLRTAVSEGSEIDRLSAEIKKKDNPDYYIAMGDKAGSQNSPERALKFYRKALAFPSARQKAQELIDKTRMYSIETSFMKGAEAAGQDFVKQALDSFVYAFELMKDVPVNMRRQISVPKNELELYYDSLFFHAQNSAEAEEYGAAYIYLRMLRTLNPLYSGLKQALDEAESELLDRAPDVFVHEFADGEESPAIGFKISAELLTSLHKILKYDAQAEAAGDFAEGFMLEGEVLDAGLESDVQNTVEKVQVQVSEEKVRNVEWDDWAKEAEALKQSGKAVPAEPEKYITRPVYGYEEYTVAFHEKTAHLSISYRLTDESGETVKSNTVKVRRTAKDESTDGIDLGSHKVSSKAANLPTDAEMNSRVRTEAVRMIAAQTAEIFSGRGEKLITEAEALAASDALAQAVEKYAGAVLIFEKHGKNFSSAEEKAREYLELLNSY